MAELVRIPTFVFTGGPRAGKSSAESIARQKLSALGYKVFFGPELASLLFGSGVDIATMAADPERMRAFQAQMVRGQIMLEDMLQRVAALDPSEKKVLFLDRGILDNAAYMDDDITAGLRKMDSILDEMGLSISTVRDTRYDGVFHLVSVARGAPELWAYDNPHRHEASPEVAAALDERIAAAWNGHRDLRIIHHIDKTPDGERKITFEEKMDRLMDNVFRVLGLPVTTHREWKFHLPGGATPRDWPVPTTELEIEQIYLRSVDPSVERRVRRVVQRGAVGAGGRFFSYGEKKTLPDGTRIPTERVIAGREFEALLLERDTSADPVFKVRHSFLWEDQYFHLDTCTRPEERTVLEVETTRAGSGPILPPFISGAVDVSDDPRFRTIRLAQGTTSD